MRRRVLLASTVVAALSPATVRAQRAGRMWRIGYLSGNSPPDPNMASFNLGMQRVGRTEGRDYEIVARFADFNYDRFPALIDELLAEKADIIITAGASTRAALLAAKSVPVVFGFSGDPVAAGFVKSLSHPGGNATGVSAMALELAGKRLSLLIETAPTVRRVGVLSNPAHPGEQSEWAATQSAAKTLGVDLNYYRIATAPDVSEAIERAQDERCGGLLTFPEALSLFNRSTIVQFAAKHRLPTAFGWKVYCQAGGLLSYGPNLAEFYSRMGFYADRILQGTKPADLPVELPTIFELAINLRTARALGLTIPPSILARADEVIE
jgi:putative ABC transport system substrate-binding protein